MAVDSRSIEHTATRDTFWWQFEIPTSAAARINPLRSIPQQIFKKEGQPRTGKSYADSPESDSHLSEIQIFF